MNIMRVFKGSFGGPTLYANSDFVSPNEARRGAKRDEREAHDRRVGEKDVRVEKMKDVKTLPTDPSDDIFA
jgi:ribosome biogenesis protein BRX1